MRCCAVVSQGFLFVALIAAGPAQAPDIVDGTISLEAVHFSFTPNGRMQEELPDATFLPGGDNVYDIPRFLALTYTFIDVGFTLSYSFTNVHPTAGRSAFPRCRLDEVPIPGSNDDANGDGVPGYLGLRTNVPVGSNTGPTQAQSGETLTVVSAVGNLSPTALLDRSTVLTFRCDLTTFVDGVFNVPIAGADPIIVTQLMATPDSLTFTTVTPEPSDPLGAGSIEQGATATLTYTLQTQDDAQVGLKLVNRLPDGTELDVIPPLFMDVVKADDGTVGFDIRDFVVPDEGSLVLKADLVAPDASVLASATDVAYEITVDLTVDHIELVQVIQTIDNAVPLIADKTTVIRPFTKIMAGPDEIIGVVVNVHAFRDGVEIADSPWRLLDVSREISSKNPNRDVIFHAHTVTLPTHWTQAGELTLRVVVNPDRTIPEVDTSNNEMEVIVLFVPGESFSIRYLPVCLAIPGLIELCPSSRVARLAGLIPKLFPLAERDFSYRGLNIPDFKLEYLLFDADPVDTWARRSRFRSQLNRLYQLAVANLVSFDQLIAWVPRGAGGRTLLGYSDPPWLGGTGRVTVGFDNSDQSVLSAEDTLVHEMSHNLVLRHPATGDSCGSRDGGTDWPYPNAGINEYGYDPRRGALKRPKKYRRLKKRQDLMSYCDESRKWISDFHYGKLLNGKFQPQPGIAAVEPAMLQDETEEHLLTRNQEGPVTVLMVSGTVDQDSNTGRLEEIYQFVSSAPLPPTNPAGNTCLRFSGQAGVISDYCLDLSFRDSETDEAFSEDAFTAVTPLPPGTTGLSLRFDDLELASRAASAASPVVEITSPNAGETWDAASEGTVTWSASDSDGDSLLYSLLYSSDNGVSWLPIAVDLTEPTYTFNPALIQGGDQVHFRVLASDGFNSSEAQQGPITVDQQPQISTPQDPVDMGRAVVGDQVTGQIVLVNTGTGPLEVGSVSIDQPEFQIVFPQGPFSIRAGSAASVELS